MKKIVSLLCTLALLLGICGTAFAEFSQPVAYYYGKKATHLKIHNYDLANGDLTIRCVKQAGVEAHMIKCVGLNEEIDFDNDYQADRGTVVAKSTITYGGAPTVTLSVEELEKYDYIKVAVGVFDQPFDIGQEINQAWLVFGIRIKDTREPADPYPPEGATLVAVARSQIGYTGSSTKSNLTGADVSKAGDYTKYGAYTGTNGQAWCASFIAWCANEAGISGVNKTGAAGPGALCPNAYSSGGVVYFNTLNETQKKNHPYLEQYGIKAERSKVTPAVGDLIFFRWSSAGANTTFSHVGVVSKVSGSTVYYIDGNGSGDVVKERSVSKTSSEIAAYCKISDRFDVAPIQPTTPPSTPQPTTPPSTPQPTTPPALDITFSAGSGVSGAPGGTVVVPVMVQNPSAVDLGVISLKFSLPDGVSIANVTACGSASGASVTQGNPTLIFRNKGITQSGKILEIVLALDKNVALPTAVNITPTVITLTSETKYAVPSFVATVSETVNRIPGDVTEDGLVDDVDFLRLAKYLAGWGVTINTSNADVNADGQVDEIDFLRLAKYLAGWAVELK